MTDDEIKVHKGEPVLVTFVGGDYHGEKKSLRSPLLSVTTVARPPKYLGGGFYDSNLIAYDTYTLKYFSDEPYYVHTDFLEGFPQNIFDDYESPNNKKLREEREAQELKEKIERENKEKIEREKEKAKPDWEKYGVGFLVDGEYVEFSRVTMLVNVANPLEITLDKLLGNKSGR